MAKTANIKNKNATAQKAATSKKSDTLKQIENLEKALSEVKPEDVQNLVPENVQADIEMEQLNKAAEEGTIHGPEINLDEEVEKIIETAEPSEEVKEQIKEFEEGKEEFNEKLSKEPEKAEQIVQEELKRAEALKKKAEAIKAKIQQENKRKLGGNEGFTNWWNGSSNLF